MTIASDLGIDETGLEKPRGTVDFLYTVFLDDAAIIPGGKTRFASGALLTKGDNDVKPRLIDVNKTIVGKSEGKQSKYIRYEVGALPKVEAVAMNHPFTGGAWSSFLMRFKVSFCSIFHVYRLHTICSLRMIILRFYDRLSPHSEHTQRNKRNQTKTLSSFQPVVKNKVCARSTCLYHKKKNSILENKLQKSMHKNSVMMDS